MQWGSTIKERIVWWVTSAFTSPHCIQNSVPRAAPYTSCGGGAGGGESPRMLKVGCPWSMKLLLWERRELGVELRGRFITWPHPVLFLSGFVIRYPMPCPLGLSTAQGGPGTIPKPHTPPLGPELLALCFKVFLGSSLNSATAS